METEEFISGFCRTCNGSQTVCCEYEEKDGKRILTFMDCAYKRCVNQGACEIYKEAAPVGKRGRVAAACRQQTAESLFKHALTNSR